MEVNAKKVPRTVATLEVSMASNVPPLPKPQPCAVAIIVQACVAAIHQCHETRWVGKCGSPSTNDPEDMVACDMKPRHNAVLKELENAVIMKPPMRFLVPIAVYTQADGTW